jgi:hypothetical protein
MPTIYSYQKYIDPLISRTLRLPESNANSPLGTELATIDGLTYVSIPDDQVLPTNQYDEISESITEVTMTDTLKEAIRLVSPHTQLIAQRIIETIRSNYTIDDEMYFARIGVGASMGLYVPSTQELQEMTVFGEFVEATRQWGRDQRALLGL